MVFGRLVTIGLISTVEMDNSFSLLISLSFFNSFFFFYSEDSFELLFVEISVSGKISKILF